MALSLLSRPIKSSCNWNAAGNPIIYKFQRQDSAYNQINNSGGFIQVQINGGNYTSYWQLANEVYVLSSSGGILSIFGAITASSFSGGNTLITLDVAYSASTGGIINNLTKRTDHKIDVDFKRGVSPNDSLLNDVHLTLSPNNEGYIYVNASILKNLLSSEWSLPASVNEVETGTSISFYISYQEYYDGALQGSATNDTSNIIFAVFAAMQIGYAHGSNMLSYIPADADRSWLTRFKINSALHGLVMWRNWPFTLSFIWPTGMAGIKIIVTELDVNGNFINVNANSVSLSSNASLINRIKPLHGITLNDNTKKINLSLINGESELLQEPSFATTTGWANSGGGSNWGIGSGSASVNLADGDASTILIGTLTSEVVSKKINYIVGNIAFVPGPGGNHAGYIDYKFYKDGASILQYHFTFSLDSVTTSADISVPAHLINDTNGFDEVRINAVVSNNPIPLGSVTITLQDFSLKSVTQLNSELNIEVRDDCTFDINDDAIIGNNPVMLFWKNSDGGDALWLFEKYHEYSYTYSNGRKAKRLVLIDTDVTITQWEAINELNSIGEVYSSPIIDLENTNTINKTSAQIGQQVYIISKDGLTKTGVIVIPSNSSLQSRNVSHAIAIEIELPEIISL